MNKLQYDSFYKFLVSVGIILITAPIIGIYYYFTGTYDIIITQEEFSQLSEFSLQSLNNRMAITKIISCVFPWVCFFLIAFGIFCMIYGCVKWHKIQTDLDEQTHLDTVMKRINAQKLTPTEVAERTISEILEDAENSSTTPTFTPSKHQEAIRRGFKIEKLFFDYIYKKQHKLYDVQQNIRVGSFEYDVIAVSKTTNTDYLYEIKAWNGPVSNAYYSKTLHRLKNATYDYLSVTKRNCITKLIIVTQENYINEFKEHFERIMSNQSDKFELTIEYYTEEQLSK